ncbi:alpha/beta-hydrolase [Schizopora paradoxa]|uniref:Alpha/beta-hydrolase n=1 Tax=Schizopora paradoxa TaxID=27342 RepID=A0A0H2RKL4_9AGAM|nr:alpha/beta-hydrolase [Schizopora paradoxa]
MPETRPYGTWPSPVTVDTISQQVVALESIVVDHVTGSILHSERRPVEGRTVIVNSSEGSDAIGKSFNARNLVNGYGGVPMISNDDVLIFSNIPDNRLYRSKGSSCSPITPDRKEWRFADLCMHPKDKSVLACVFEDQTDPRPQAVSNALALVYIDTGKVSVISKGWDFYASPVFSPDGSKLAFLRWNHPNMPWQSCQLVVADVIKEDNSYALAHETIIVGESERTSAQQPQWLSETTLLFTYDEGGWSQLWKHDIGGNSSPILHGVVEEEFAEPLWKLGESSYAILDESHVLCKSVRGGFSLLSLIDIATGRRTEIKSPYISINSVRQIDSQTVAFIGSKFNEGSAVVKLSLTPSGGIFRDIVKSSELPLDPKLAPKPQMLQLKDIKGRPLFVLYHPPTNPKYVGPADERPPCLVSVHGGPTSRTEPGFTLDRLLYTSRGWAWIDVFYGGSTGFGRSYIERLDSNWGVLDPDDCAAAVKQLADTGVVDKHRVVIRGYSAGGYNVLQSLIAHPKVYACGTAFYGIANMKRLHETTHKFQSQYIPGLLGGTPEEIPEVYEARSPLFNADKIVAPLLLLHGSADLQVPVEQTRSIAKVIRENGNRVELEIYEGEGHGFRLAKNIKASLEKELKFYHSILFPDT